jgi:hypothetical protein
MRPLRAWQALIPILAATSLGSTALPARAAGQTTLDPAVDVRVETPAWTTVEQNVMLAEAVGPVNMVNGPDYSSPSDYPGGSSVCDGRNNGNPQGYTSAGATPITALNAAVRQTDATWYAPFDTTADDFPLIYRIGTEGPANHSGPFFSIYLNGEDVSGKGCQVQLEDGDDVVFTQDGAGLPVLELDGPADAHAGQTVTFTVTEEATGEPVTGADVYGYVTNAKGEARFKFDAPGTRRLRAEKPGDAVRSAALSVCVDKATEPSCRKPDGTAVEPPAAPTATDVRNAPVPNPEAKCFTNGHDGRCGTKDQTPPQARITSVREQEVFLASRAPFVFRGHVGVPYTDRNALEAEPLKAVKLRLTRNHKGHCSYYSPHRKRLVPFRRCGAPRGFFFKIGNDADWRYELPIDLPKGRYVLDVNAVDAAENRDWPAALPGRRYGSARRGENRVVFRVA